MRTKLIVALVIGIIVAVVLLMRGENTHNSATVPGTAEQASNLPVEVTKPAFEEVERTLDAVGSFFPEDEVTVGSEVDGIIKRLLVDEGSTVKQGDLLLEIDDAKLRLEVEESEAMLREGRARLERATSRGILCSRTGGTSMTEMAARMVISSRIQSWRTERISTTRVVAGKDI